MSSDEIYKALIDRKLAELIIESGKTDPPTLSLDDLLKPLNSGSSDNAFNILAQKKYLFEFLDELEQNGIFVDKKYLLAGEASGLTPALCPVAHNGELPEMMVRYQRQRQPITLEDLEAQGRQDVFLSSDKIIFHAARSDSLPEVLTQLKYQGETLNIDRLTSIRTRAGETLWHIAARRGELEKVIDALGEEGRSITADFLREVKDSYGNSVLDEVESRDRMKDTFSSRLRNQSLKPRPPLDAAEDADWEARDRRRARQREERKQIEALETEYDAAFLAWQNQQLSEDAENFNEPDGNDHRPAGAAHSKTELFEARQGPPFRSHSPKLPDLG